MLRNNQPVLRHHIAGGSVSNFHTGGPYQRYVYQITSDITAHNLDQISRRNRFQTGKFIWCPVQQLSQKKKYGGSCNDSGLES